MAGSMIYTRTYSASSAGQLVAAKTPTRSGHLSQEALLEEFRLHSDKENRIPTALVSASNRIVEAVQRAFDKRHRNSEPPGDIWIAFIEKPSAISKTACSPGPFGKRASEEMSLRGVQFFSPRSRLRMGYT